MRHRKRHYVIPDCQIRPGDPIDHLHWIAADIVRRRPDVIVCLGDFWDFPSLSTHTLPGSMEKEGARVQADIEAGNVAMAALVEPIHAEIARLKRNKEKQWKPRMVFIEGNHEARISRFAQSDSRFQGVVGTHLCRVEEYGWERVPFEVPIEIDGVWYCHYWKNPHSKFTIGGTIDNRLNKLGFSFVQGHEQGLRYGNRPLPNGRTTHGLVAGSCYLGTEGYRGPQGANEWRGVVVLQDVRGGCMGTPMFLDLDWLCGRYAKADIVPYMEARYPGKSWSHLGAVA